jgi:polysaccharide export outer membrane protein
MSNLILRIIAGVLFLNSCAAEVVSKSDHPQGQSAEIRGNSNGQIHESNDVQRLAHLWQSRRQDRSTGDFPVGAGDLLVIHVAGMEELQDRTVRVSPTGLISLPFVGLVNITGMTENALTEEIRKRLQKDIIRNPQVTLLAKETLSRQVAVVGAVHKPGLYNLAGSSDTILGMISQAGGMRTDAAERILFIPAEPAAPDKAKEIIDALPVKADNPAPTPLILKDVDPLVIQLDRVNRSTGEIYLNMPARPGDVVMVPGGGEVLIQGWVERPGAYKISSVLTVLGAIAAAGGTSFPADTSSVELIRTNKQGDKSKLVANLEAIRNGAQRDLPLREGDVIDVVSSSPRWLVWGFYRMFTSIINVGASASIPIR